MLVVFMVWDVCCVAVLGLWILCADAPGNVNREEKKMHREPAGLESGGISFPRKLPSHGPERGKVNRGDCISSSLTSIQMRKL